MARRDAGPFCYRAGGAQLKCQTRAVMPEATEGDFLVLSGISKRYGGVRALENVDFSCARGKIHAVLGENGAGKSPVIKIVAGVVQPDAGAIELEGVPRQFSNPAA